MPGNQITFGIGFNVNESNLNSLKQSLKEIQQLTSKDLVNIGKASSIQEANAQLQQIKKSASEVQSALTRAFNTDLGTVNVARFNQELKAMNIGKIAADFNNAGAAGQSAFLAITSQAMSTNTQLKQSYNWLSQIGTTLANTVKWNIASTAVNAFSNSISSAFNYVKVLDASLTDIRIVTGQSREEMAQFAVEANRAAQSLGRQTKEYTNAALAFYQQGLSDQEVRVRTEASLKAQNITGAGTEIVDQLTAVWNGFQATIDQTESYVDKLAAVADSSASNLSELATGMSKVASVANNVGVDIDSLTAQLATIIATTRQAPETVGNALKTIYARINDIKAGSDEAEISLGNYTGKMAELGFSVLDADGRLKDTGDTITEIGERWATLSKEQQIYLAQTMAGQRQMNNLIALFDHWEQYSEMLNVSLGAQGTLNEKNARYMDSLAAHINTFRTAVEGMQDSLLNEDALMDVYDIGTKLVNVVQNIIDGMGGMRGMLLGLGALGATVFRDQIANSITTAINNVNVYKQNLEETQHLQEILQMFDITQSKYDSGTLAPNYVEAIQGVRQLREEFASYGDVASQAQKEAFNGLLKTKAEISSEVLAFDELTKQATDFGNAVVNLMTSQGFDDHDLFNLQEMFSTDLNSGAINVLEKGSSELQRLIEVVRYGKDEIDSLLNTLSKTQEAVTGQENITEKIDQQRQKVQELKEAYIKAQEAQKSAAARSKITGDNQPLEEATQAAERAKQAYEDAAGTLSELEAAHRDANEAIALFVDSIQGELNALNLSKEQTQAVQQALDMLKDPTQSNEVAFRKLKTALEGAGDGAAQILAKLLKLEQHINEHQAKVETFSNSWERLKATMSDTQIAKSIADTLRGVTSLAMGYNSLRAAAKTYQNIQEGTTSAMDGWLSIITSVGFGLPMVIDGINKVTGSFGNLKAAVVEALPAIGAFMMEFGPIIAVAAAAAIAVAGFYLIVTQSERELQSAQKAADKAGRTYADAKKAYEDLKKSISEYQDAKTAISELTTGTEEWRDAIIVANEKVLELLQNYPKLAKYLKEGANGELSIDEEGLNEVLGDAASDERNAYQERLFRQIDVTSAQAKNVRQITDPKAMQNLMDPITDVVEGATEEFALSMVHLAEVLKSEYEDVYKSILDANGNAEQIDEIFKDLVNTNIDAFYAVIDAAHRNPNNAGNRKDIVDYFAANTSGIVNFEAESTKLTNMERNAILDANKVTAREIARSWIEDLSEGFQEGLTEKGDDFKQAFVNMLGGELLDAYLDGDAERLNELKTEDHAKQISSIITDFANAFNDPALTKVLASFAGGNKRFDFSNVTNTATNQFANCYSLIRLKGFIYYQSFSLTNSTLMPVESLVEVLTNLPTVSSSKTITLGTTNKNKLTAEQMAIATEKGWTIA